MWVTCQAKRFISRSKRVLNYLGCTNVSICNAKNRNNRPHKYFKAMGTMSMLIDKITEKRTAYVDNHEQPDSLKLETKR